MQTDDIGFDVSSALDSISSDIFGGREEPQETQEAAVETETAETPVTEVAAETPTEPQPEPLAPPSSWSKDKHEYWGKMPREAQEYYMTREKQMLDGLEQYKGDAGFGRQLKEAFTPYKAFLNAQGIDEAKAVSYLMNAHYKLSSAPAHERQAYFAQLAKSYGLELPTANKEEANVDPNVKAFQEKFNQLETQLTQREQAILNERKTQVAKEVEAFAAENPYFDEVADDIIPFLNHGMPLKDAYERAIWANPVTRAKETARLQTEAEAKLKEKAKKDAEVAKKATSVNVRNRDTGTAPTAPKGTMEDTMRETLAKIRARST
jgi:hypothetical protein